MNERILKLAEQSGVQHKVMLDDSGRDIDVFVTKYDGSVPSEQNWEKFAALIVHRCAEIADQCAEHGSWMAGYRMKQHFRV